MCALTLMLCACTVNLPQHSAAAPLPEHWRHEGDGAPFELQGWWKVFNDTALDELVAQVTDANLDVRAMAARVAAAEALEHAAGAQFRPSLRFASAPAETPDSRGAYLQSGPEVTWPLGLFGRAKATADAAVADTELTRTDGWFLQTKIVAETVRSFIEWRASVAASSNLDARIAAQTDRTELMRARVRLRLASAAELAEEEARLEELQSRRLVVAHTVTEAREQLGLLAATADAYPPIVTGAGIPKVGSPRVQSIPADLLRSRADVRRAEQEAIKAAAELHIAEADLYPQLTLIGSLTLSLPIAGGASGHTNTLAALAPAIDIPLFDWGRRRAIVTARDRNLEAALIAYQESILKGVHEVEVALAALQSLGEDTELRRRAAQRAQETDRTTSIAVRMGRVSRLDALTRTLERLDTEDSLAASERARSLAFVALCEALGGSLPGSPT